MFPLRPRGLAPLLACVLSSCASSEGPAIPGSRQVPGTPVALTPRASDQREFETLRSQLAEAHDITKDEFEQRYAVTHENTLSYAPLTADHLATINESTFKLDGTTRAVLAKHGFAVQKGVTFENFLRGYEALYREDMPLYVSADSLLEAVYKSYDDMLKDIELASLYENLEKLLEQLHKRLEAGRGDVGEARVHLDLYLTVARSLLSGTEQSPHFEENATLVSQILSAVYAESGQRNITLFGSARDFDFSQFKPRGHYADSLAPRGRLPNYFRAMIWLGRTDFRLIETKPDGSQQFMRPQTDAAFGMLDLFNEDSLRRYEVIDTTIGEFIGEHDSMVIGEVQKLAADLGLKTPKDSEKLSDQALANAIIEGGYGTQRIASHFMVNGGKVQTLPLNRSFALMGQRYVLDSHVLSNVVYDRTEAMRMMPNPLDVAFAALANDQAASLLARELDQYAYHGDLHAARLMVDAHGKDYFAGNLYNAWLSALRKLSKSELPEKAPATMKSEAWGRRVLNTQLSSWAELRHNTVAYVKQSTTSGVVCEFPDAYVDPYPAFYRALGAYAERALAMTDRLETFIDPAWLDMLRDHLMTMRSAMSNLESMAEAELEGRPFTPEQLAFINEAVRYDELSGGCGLPPMFEGWYPRLYFHPPSDFGFSPTVADVHTQPEDAGGRTVGRVLHAGTGKVHPLIVTVETCSGPRAYVGLASSYHELITNDFERLNDEEWGKRLESNSVEIVPFMKDLVQ